MDTSEIIRAAGGPVRVANLCGLRSHSTVSEWAEVPPRHVLKVADASGIAPHVIRPDIYRASVGITDDTHTNVSRANHASVNEGVE